MAIELIWDTVQDAEVQQSLNNGDTIVRTALAKGVEADVATPSSALLVALASVGVPLLGDVHPNQASALCIHRIARGVGGGLVRLWIHYVRPGGGGAPIERFAADDSVVLQNEPMSVFPGTAKQLRCSTTDTAPDPEAADPPATDRPITANYPATVRALVLYGLFADRPSNAVKNSARKVNSATWQGLPRGYWRCEGPQVHYSSRDGMYIITVGFLNKGEEQGEDWSTYEIARSQSGEPAKVKDSILAARYAENYEYGVRWNKDGLFKAGFYRTSNFSATFGDSFPIGD
jgi:hypothetical protein